MKSHSPFKLAAKEFHIWRVSLVSETQACRPEILSLAEKERAAGMSHIESRERFLSSHRALRRILSRYTGCEPARIEFKTSIHGKPEVEGVKFSLSHSGELALVAVSLDEVGVDVERVRSMRRLDAFIQRFFDADEVSQVMQAEHKLHRFFEIWTRKEAYLKALGIGLRGADQVLHGFQVHGLDVPEGYRAALATVSSDPRLTYWDFAKDV